MARLDIYLFGQFRVLLDGVPVIGFQSDKVRALLAYLVLEMDHAHRREKLAGLLWPDHAEPRARQSLSQALYNLRLVTGDASAFPRHFLSDRQTVGFNGCSDHWLDAALIAQVLGSSAPYPTDGEAASVTEAALALFCGDLLEGFTLQGCAEFEEWLVLQQERYHRLVTDACWRLALAYEELGSVYRALRCTRRLLELEPWREEAHRRAMRLLMSCGRRSEALEHYHVCRRLLAQEFGVGLSQKTEQLYASICDEVDDYVPVWSIKTPHISQTTCGEQGMRRGKLQKPQATSLADLFEQAAEDGGTVSLPEVEVLLEAAKN